MVLVTLVSVIVGAVVTVTVEGARAERGAHDRQEAILAASDRLGGQMPEGTGGAIAPSPPVDRWSDVVYASNGSFVPLEQGTTPNGTVIRRQWQVTSGPNGTRRLEVSAELVNPTTLEPTPGLDGYRVVLAATR